MENLERTISSINLWASGIAYEARYWSRWAETKGGGYADDFKRRMDPDAQLDHFARLMLPVGSETVSILDIGAGPLTCLGKKTAGKEIQITPVDPLARIYDRILAKSNIVPIARTIFAMGEYLRLTFSSNSFDIVHCQNALDHSADPIKVIWQMLDVCKVDGRVILRHAHNEAENENYSGFHQWNITNDSKDMIIWNRSSRSNVSSQIAEFADSEIHLTDGYYINSFIKRRDVPKEITAFDPEDFTILQQAIIDYFANPECPSN